MDKLKRWSASDISNITIGDPCLDVFDEFYRADKVDKQIAELVECIKDAYFNYDIEPNGARWHRKAEKLINKYMGE
jgi:hypothetical protein